MKNNVEVNIQRDDSNIESNSVGYNINESTNDNNSEAESTISADLKELANKWKAQIGETGALICNKITMSRKDYLKHTKKLTQEDLLKDPLLYVLFRSEEQGEANFFLWIDRFPKAKDESK